MRPFPLVQKQSGFAESFGPCLEGTFTEPVIRKQAAIEEEVSKVSAVPPYHLGATHRRALVETPQRAGLDLCMGGDDCFGGVLIRAIQTPVKRINGPSLVVDEILSACGEASVTDLVNKLPSLSCDDETSWLRVVRMNETSNLPVFSTARVGLSLRKFNDSSSRPLDFIARRYARTRSAFLFIALC